MSSQPQFLGTISKDFHMSSSPREAHSTSARRETGSDGAKLIGVFTMTSGQPQIPILATRRGDLLLQQKIATHFAKDKEQAPSKKRSNRATPSLLPLALSGPHSQSMARMRPCCGLQPAQSLNDSPACNSSISTSALDYARGWKREVLLSSSTNGHEW